MHSVFNCSENLIVFFKDSSDFNTEIFTSLFIPNIITLVAFDMVIKITSWNIECITQKVNNFECFYLSITTPLNFVGLLYYKKKISFIVFIWKISM